MTAPVNEPPRTTWSVGALRHGVLNLADAFAQSLALLSLALGVATATSAAAISAGAATPWAYIVAGVGCLCLASVIVRFTARMASAGGIYTYIARGLHPNGGFIGGWLYGTAFAVGISFVMCIGAVTMATLFDQHTSWSPSWFQCFLILLGGLLLFAFFDIRLSTRTQLVLGAAGVAAILLLAVVILAKGGDSGVTLQPLNPENLPSTHGLFLAVVFAFTGFIGFEAAAVLGEEAADPRRAIPRAILTAAVVAVVWYVFITWTMSVGFGVANAGKWAQDVAPLDTLANRYSGTWLSVLVDIAVITSAFIASLAGLHLTARTFFAMGREGRPAASLRVDPPSLANTVGRHRLLASDHLRARPDSRSALDEPGARPLYLHPVHGADRHAGSPQRVHPRRALRHGLLLAGPWRKRGL
jgi:amino acid transporter